MISKLLLVLGVSKLIIIAALIVGVMCVGAVAILAKRAKRPSVSIAMISSSPSSLPTESPTSQAIAKQSPLAQVTQKTRPTAAKQPLLSPKAVPSSFQFTRLPFDAENVGAISSLGDLGQVSRSQTGSGHPYGNERHFIWHKKPLGRDLYNVYAPGDGTLSRFKMTNAPPYGLQYQLYFRIDNNRTYYLAHINKLEPGLEAKISQALGGQINETGTPQEMNNTIAVKAGDILGQTGATAVNWDWGLIDNSYADGITDPSHYTGLEAAHSRSVYDLSSADVKAQLRQLSGIWNSVDQTFRARVGDPALGIVGTDVKGTLSGTWFQTYDFNPYPHLAIFSPYAYDTSKLQIMLEIPDLDLFGRYQADEIQALNGVGLNPTSIAPTSDIVSYYLKNGAEDGVLMVRVNTDETISVEAIKGVQTRPDNFTFSSRAITLKR